jgi:hypothetical protein
VRFPEFLRVTVLLCAAAATLLGALTLAGAAGTGDDLAVIVGAGWWLVSAALGVWLGRRSGTSPPIAALLACARTQTSLPEIGPARIVLNRLWPLIAATVVAGGLSFALPQVPAVGAGFAIIWALSWRHQAQAVRAIEQRDGARFYILRTSPLAPIRLVRTPGFRSNLFELNGSGRRAGSEPAPRA